MPLGVGFVVGMIFASATGVVLRANQVLCGLALTLMGTGLATIGKAYSRNAGEGHFCTEVEIPYLVKFRCSATRSLPQNILVYLIYIVLPVAAFHHVPHASRQNLRAVGENPRRGRRGRHPCRNSASGVAAGSSRGRRRGLSHAGLRSVVV